MIKFKTMTLSLLVFLFYNLIKYVKTSSEIVNGGNVRFIDRYQVANINIEHVHEVYVIALWILLGSLAKIGFHYSKSVTKNIPESCLLIVLGVIIGGILYATKLADENSYVLKSEVFFIFLLPPIILEAGYFMPNRPFFDNIATILLFAIVNTLFNTLLIGLTLWAFNFTGVYGDTKFELLPCFLFAALISAVDPVAVLATFVEIGVNDMLYIIVFGESLLNDAVSVVLYRLFAAFTEMGSENIIAVDVLLGAASFAFVAIGGVLIGIFFGFIGSFTTKYTEHIRILEPLIVISYSYLAYLTAEMVSASGILAITFCGMFLKQYVELNIGKKSSATIEYVLKMLANIMETIIFLFIGISVESDMHSWNTGFVIITLVSCSIYRVAGVFLFATIANTWRLKELKINDMLIMSYGGIRGAVAFALALILEEKIIPTKKEFVTATTVVVFFTVFVQGVTIAPIVNLLQIKRKQNEEPCAFSKLTNRIIDHLMTSLECINGVSGKHSLRQRVRKFDRKFLKKILCREKPESDHHLLKRLDNRRVSHAALNSSIGRNSFPPKQEPETNVENETNEEIVEIPINRFSKEMDNYYSIIPNNIQNNEETNIVNRPQENDNVHKEDANLKLNTKGKTLKVTFNKEKVFYANEEPTESENTENYDFVPDYINGILNFADNVINASCTHIRL